jgi:hypothetical protein
MDMERFNCITQLMQYSQWNKLLLLHNICNVNSRLRSVISEMFARCVNIYTKLPGQILLNPAECHKFIWKLQHSVQQTAVTKPSKIWTSSKCISKFSSYLTANTIHFHFKDLPINSHYGNNWCLCWELQETVIHCVGKMSRFKCYSGWYTKWPHNFKRVTDSRRSLSWVANCSSASHKIPHILCNLDVHYHIHPSLSWAR